MARFSDGSASNQSRMATGFTFQSWRPCTYSTLAFTLAACLRISRSSQNWFQSPVVSRPCTSISGWQPARVGYASRPSVVVGGCSPSVAM